MDVEERDGVWCICTEVGHDGPRWEPLGHWYARNRILADVPGAPRDRTLLSLILAEDRAELESRAEVPGVRDRRPV
jgi:hypothetical protein